MRRCKVIVLALLCVGIIIMFFSSDFGVVEIEKNALITALAIDKEQDEYLISAQIVLPEATDSSSGDEKSLLTAKAKTVSEAIRKLGSTTGWYPKLSFCNLILIGKDMLGENVMRALDYFENTLKVQYSAIVAACDGKAAEFLTETTPLDNVTSFSIQKILLQGVGHLQNCVDIDIKTFSVGYYSRNASSYMAMLKKVQVETDSSSGQQEFGGSGESSGGNSGGNSSSSGGSKQTVFDATSTLLFKNGLFVGELSSEETQVFNYISKKVSKSAIAVNGVITENQMIDYVLAVLDNGHSVKLTFENGNPVLNVKADIYARIDDQNGDSKFINLNEKEYFPEELKRRAEYDFEKNLNTLFEKCKNTGCDFLNATELLYRTCHSEYSAHKNTLLNDLTLKADINFHAQSR